MSKLYSRAKGVNCNKPFRRDRSSGSPSDSDYFYKGKHNEKRSSGSSSGRDYFHKGRHNEKRSSGSPSGSDHFHKGRFENFSSDLPSGSDYFCKGKPNEKRSSDSPSGRDCFHKGRHNEKRSKHPSGLKGKEIGLWYRDKNRQQEPKPITISLETSKIEEIEYVLSAAEALSLKEGIKKGEDEYLQLKFLKEKNISFEEKLNAMEIHAIKPDPNVDEELYKEWKEKTINNDNYKKMLEFRQKLPTFKKRENIINLINTNQMVVISGETGCGKTTQVAQFILDDYISKHQGSLFKAICTQPRRISAISLAERVAAERGELLGNSVGYHIRLESELPQRKKGTITFVTTGVLIQRLQSDPILNEYSHLFIDEVHERNTICDFLLTLLKYILPKRPDLKVILMSATINSEKFSEYFGRIPCLKIPGFTYAVKEIYLEDILPKVPFRFSAMKSFRAPKFIDPVFRDYVIPYVNNLEKNHIVNKSVAIELRNPDSEKLNIDLIAQVVFYISKNEEEGAILVFVPGLSQIQDLHRILSKSPQLPTAKTVIIPMHSIMSSGVQKSAFTKYPKGVRKIIISTSICETSVTIDDVRYVVDCGKNKLQNFDLIKNVQTLEPEWETLANVRQRRGRAGRTQAGKCYKLFTKAREETFESFPLPDIQRCRLEEVILNAKTLNLGNVGPFFKKLLDPPDPKGVALSLKMLRTLNLLDGDERLTPLGYHVAKLPVDPQTGKMIVMGALFSCLDPILSIAACLNFKDPFKYVFDKEELIQEKRDEFSLGEKSDHFMFSNVMLNWEESSNPNQFAYENFLSHHNLQFLRDMKKQFASYLYEMKFIISSNPKDRRNNFNSDNASLIKAIVCSGLYPNVARIKKIKKSKKTNQLKYILWETIDHPRVQFHIKSLMDKIKSFESPFVVYFEKIKSSVISLYEGTMVYPMPLLFFGERCDIIKGHQYFIEVDDMIKFSCTRKTAELVQKLRKELVWILQEAVRNPGWIDWRKEERKTLILKSIVELITLEDQTTLDKLGVEYELE